MFVTHEVVSTQSNVYDIGSSLFGQELTLNYFLHFPLITKTSQRYYHWKGNIYAEGLQHN